MKVALIDYGIGNLRSVRKAIEAVGGEVIQTDQSEIILNSPKVILPGVGAFKDGMIGLQQRGLIPTLKAIIDNETPFLGICLGMQLFFDSSTEMGSTQGLGFITGNVRLFSSKELKIPQTGWNQLVQSGNSPLLYGIENGAYVYFNHSYYCAPKQNLDVIAHTDYGITYASAIQKSSLYGVQFHPEKSQEIGLQILKNFLELC